MNSLNKDEHKQELLEQYFKKYYKELCVYCNKFTQNFDEAQDVVQDVFVKLLTRPSGLEINDPKSFLYTSVRNAAINRIKQLKKTSLVEEITPYINEKDFSIESEMLESEKKIKLYKAIDKLPEQCRKIFLSYGVRGLKYKQIAEEFDISINTVKTQMKIAYKSLRSHFRDNK